MERLEPVQYLRRLHRSPFPRVRARSTQTCHCLSPDHPESHDPPHHRSDKAKSKHVEAEEAVVDGREDRVEELEEPPRDPHGDREREQDGASHGKLAADPRLQQGGEGLRGGRACRVGVVRERSRACQWVGCTVCTCSKHA